MYTILLGLCIKTILFLVCIYLCHSGWIYLKDTYSTKKTKDLVNTQVNKYKQIIQEIQENRANETSLVLSQSSNKETNQDMNQLLTDFMENEL
jgi:hypothetical protein